MRRSIILLAVLVIGCRSISPPIATPCTLTVRGYVNSPGEYVVSDPNRTTIAEIVSLAGGLSPGTPTEEYRAVFKRYPIRDDNPTPLHIKASRWHVPLNRLRIDIRQRYNALYVEKPWGV